MALGHVKAHIGIPGNERADQLAKEATEQHTIDHSLPVPSSYIRRIKSKIVPQWQDHWDYTEDGRHTYKLIPKVTRILYNLTPPTTAFLTGHGLSQTYLQYNKKARTGVYTYSYRGSRFIHTFTAHNSCMAPSTS